MPRLTTSNANSFIKGLGHCERLTPEEETRVAAEYRRTGDTALYHRLVQSQLPLVVKIARASCFRESTLPDLIQEGAIGLMRAVRKYDPTRGVRLSTYAAWWIKAFVFQYCLTNGRVMRVATTLPQRRLFFALRKEQARLKANGEAPDSASIARALNVPVADVVEMESRLSGRDVPLDGATPEELATELPAADDLLSRERIHAAVRSAMSELRQSMGERERSLLEHRLGADEPLSLEDLGRPWGVSRERVRQLEQRLKKRLQPHLAPLAGMGDTDHDARAAA